MGYSGHFLNWTKEVLLNLGHKTKKVDGKKIYG